MQLTPENLQNEEILKEILINSRKTKNYMKWQLIITIAFVVLPILAMVFVIPFVINSLSTLYLGTGIN